MKKQNNSRKRRQNRSKKAGQPPYFKDVGGRLIFLRGKYKGEALDSVFDRDYLRSLSRNRLTKNNKKWISAVNHVVSRLKWKVIWARFLDFSQDGDPVFSFGDYKNEKLSEVKDLDYLNSLLDKPLNQKQIEAVRDQIEKARHV